MAQQVFGQHGRNRPVADLAAFLAVALLLVSCAASGTGRHSSIGTVSPPPPSAATSVRDHDSVPSSSTMEPATSRTTVASAAREERDDPASVAATLSAPMVAAAQAVVPDPAPVQATPSATAPAAPAGTPAAVASGPKPAPATTAKPAPSKPSVAIQSPCSVAVAYIAAHGAPGWITDCGYHAGYDNPGCVAAAESVGGRYPYGCTDVYNHTTYIACPVFTVYANEAENQRYVSGLGGRFDAYGEAPQCAWANPLGR